MRSVLRLFAPLLLGILIGASAMTVHNGRQVEQLMFSVKVLKEKLAAAQQEVEELRTNLTTEKRQVVTGIEVEVHFSDSLTSYEEQEAELAIEKKIKEWLEPLYGEELDKLNPRMIPQIIDGRDVPVESNKYRLTTRIVLIREEVFVYLEAKIEQPDDKPKEIAKSIKSTCAG